MTDVVERLRSALSDRYAIESELGRGGMATVYLARDLKHDRKVAIKVLRPELSATIGAERFLREISISAKLNHPHILPLLDSGSIEQPSAVPPFRRSDALLYYVMPYVEGESLRDRLGRERQLPLKDVVTIAHEVASALDYAHSQGVVHRDIKPENILLQAGKALVADFGIARAVDVAGGERLTETGMAVGTPAYMSPEQATAGEIDARSDVYALGCVVYEMLAGEPPFTGPTAQAILARHSVDPVPSLRTVRKALSQDLESVINTALEKVPADRYPSATGFADALANPPRAASASRIRWQRAALVGVPLVALVAVGLVLITTRTGATALRSIAVLPCDNLSRDPELEYISDHYTDQIISKLSKVGSLVPKSWLRMRDYRGTDKNSQEIASELGTNALVRCQALENEQGAQLAVQLIRADNDDVIWSDEYRTLPVPDSINGILSEAARQIAAALGAPVLVAEEVLLSATPTQDSAALDLFRLGQHFYYQATTDGLQTAVDYFERAIEADSGFSLAHSWLAEALAFLYDMDLKPYIISRIEELTNKALELDSTNAHAYARRAELKAYILGLDDWETDFERALQLEPNSVETHLWYGFNLAMKRRYDEGLAEMRKAEELDPINPNAQAQQAQFLTRARRFDEAVEAGLRGLRFNPGYNQLRIALGFTYLARGDYSEALTLLEEAQGQVPAPAVLAFLAYGYGKTGRRADAQRMLDSLFARSRVQQVRGAQFAYFYAGLGEVDSVYARLTDQFAEEGDAACWWVTEAPFFDEYRADPRIQRLLTEHSCPVE